MTRRATLWLSVAVLAACHGPPKPAPVALPVPPLPTPPPPVQRPLPPLPAVWSFAITNTACEAEAAHRDLALAVHVGNDGKVVLRLAGTVLRRHRWRAGTRAEFRFVGAAGLWALQSRFDADRTFVAVAPLDEISAGQVLELLGGGSLNTSAPADRIPALKIPDANVSGREWFDCVRHKLAL
jgi:hypothetical protein